jgi:asparagine synthase (glutamine-hydrolysing)
MGGVRFLRAASTTFTLESSVCGLAGCRRRDGRPADPADILQMLDRQRHRGPDDRGVWTSGPTALGLDRLSILDLSPHGHQPFVTPDGAGVIAYNGEVYNWRALRRDLETEGVRFTSQCDTEVVLHAMHRWGPEAAVPRFDGMFALAYVDRRSDTLWLARDRTGIKPLYVAEPGPALVFASEAKALLGHPDVPCRPDLHALVTQVYLERLVGGWTPFQGVTELTPGTMLRVTSHAIETLTWFDAERDVDIDRILASAREPFSHHLEQFRQLLEQSVELHLRSDAPLAVMCSGGVDSSLITAIARRHKPDLVAFVADAVGLVPSEADKAEQVAKHLGVQLQRVRITAEDFPQLWAEAAWHNDVPIYFQQNPLALAVSKAVRDAGFKVLVTGEGSDELFMGYGWQAAVGRMWRLRQWHARVVPDVAPLRRFARWLQWLMPFDLAAMAQEPFDHRTALGGAPPAAELVIDGGIRRGRARSLFARFDRISDLGERAMLARQFDDIYHHLRVVLASNDRMTMAASIEARVPFLETDLIDFGLHLAPRAKYGRRQPKRVVKALAETLLPKDIVHARKVGFAVPGRFLDGYEEIVRDGFVPEWFKWGARETPRMFELMRAEPLLGRKVIGVELWAQMYFNGRSPAEMAERLRGARGAGGDSGPLEVRVPAP